MNQKRIKKQHLAVIIASIAVLIAGTSFMSSSFATSSHPDQYVAKISSQTAADIAVQNIGAQPSNLVKVDLDNENGSFVYSATIVKGDQEFDVKVDPQTGQILNVEQDLVGTDTSDETDNDADTNDGKSVSDGDGETADDNTASNEPAAGDGDGETADDLG